jgi:hypothetical protein
MARTVAEVQSDLDACYAARRQIMSGERVDEVCRDGRRITFAKMTLAEVKALIDQLERELEQARAEESGRPRRRAIPLAWQN